MTRPNNPAYTTFFLKKSITEINNNVLDIFKYQLPRNVYAQLHSFNDIIDYSGMLRSRDTDYLTLIHSFNGKL